MLLGVAARIRVGGVRRMRRRVPGAAAGAPIVPSLLPEPPAGPASTSPVKRARVRFYCRLRGARCGRRHGPVALAGRDPGVVVGRPRTVGLAIGHCAMRSGAARRSTGNQATILSGGRWGEGSRTRDLVRFRCAFSGATADRDVDVVVILERPFSVGSRRSVRQ